MKILLVGEYSRLHNSLKEGLTALGHQVVLVGSGDHFKNYAVDYSIRTKWTTQYWLPRKIKNAIYRFSGLDLEMTEKAIRFYRLLPQLKGFDHIQLINSDALETHPYWSRKLYKKLFDQNPKVNPSLLICGDETPVNDYLLQDKLKYSVLTPYLKDRSLQPEFEYSLKYTYPNYRKLFNWVSENCKTLIVSDLDYKIPMEAMGNTVAFIPNPINSDTIPFTSSAITDTIIIFLGINRLSYTKKGISYFEAALEIIQKKYPEQIEVIVTENVPYAVYINSYNKAHILLDQVYGFDQGYNALEAMAKGKVVFTGAETEFTKHYNLPEKVAINAVPDVAVLVSELSFLIENPQEITAIGQRARQFIEKEHYYTTIANRYLETWTKSKV
ncbi:glycosyltransferase [Flavobacterium supellecticarium]|uniref:Glycosyltransferase n=1 Tax=Flavobacterium supellecticarium TaxID=2565924 RepID=A0A4S3ZZM7_9FLAO|nr:glycosyltransferase [Flavobacterium supellecticarium]THF51453.1 glycosyltransferase [Flavobacterium supellecticarium]